MFQFKGTRVPLNSTVLANILISFSVICLLMSCQGLRHVRNSLEDIVVDQSLGRAHIGIEIRSVSTGRYLFTQNAQQHFIPASNMKLYTTAAAILSLTPDFTYETRLMTDGSITNGVLKGNLIIIGSGDPSISGYFNGGNITAVFEDWSKALTQKGVKRIDGNIYIDNSYFTESAYGRGWQLDDLTHCYAAARDALSFNNNCIAITVHAGSEIGSPAIIRIEPDTRYLKLTNRVVSSNPGGHVSVVKAGSEDSLALTGHIPLNSKPYVLFEPVRRPALFAGSVFNEILSNNGIAVDGEIKLREVVITTTGMPALTPIASHRSPPLYEIVKVINTISNNLYAENLLLTIGKETSGHGTLRHAEMAVRQTLEKAGVHLEGFRMADGSGLSRLNLITPHDTVELLYYMAKGAHAKTFMDSLAAPGNKGTLQRFSADAPAPSAVKAKTGSMTNVRNLSGYITAANGELFAFSFLCNNSTYPAERVDSLYNQILRYIAETAFLRD